MSKIIEFQSVSKSYGDLQVLRNLDMHVEAGEKLALIGPSGSGKTTILRILMTLETINSGHVMVENDYLWHQKVNGELVPASEKHLRKMRQNKSDATNKARELLELVGLEDKQQHYPHQLSGGQQQRVAIARALAMDPKIMLFDEVTSALDPELVEEVLNVLRMLASKTDTTMLTVTHEMNFARDFADRVLFFEKGQIVESGPPEKIFKNPKEERTRNFLKQIIGDIA